MEETGNLLIMLAAVAQQQNDHSVAYLDKYWPLLDVWAKFLDSYAKNKTNIITAFVFFFVFRFPHTHVTQN